MCEKPDNPLEIWTNLYSGLPKSSKANKKSVVSRFGDWLNDGNGTTDNVLDADLMDVKNWLEHLHDNDGLTGSTVDQYQSDLRGFYKSWMDNGGNNSILAEEYYELDKNPANFDLSQGLDFSTTPVKQTYAENNEGIIHVKPSEIRELRKAADSVRDELLIKILSQTGLRRSELAALKLPEHKSDSHIDTERGVVVIAERDSKTDNGGRTVPYQDLQPELSMWLQGYRDRHYHADDSPYLLITKRSKQISPYTITDIVTQLAEKAGIQETYSEDANGNSRGRITPHSLRSSFVIQCFDAGLSSPEVMEMSGHEELATVEKYANVLDDDAITAYREADIEFEA